jgi:hypothetical protein
MDTTATSSKILDNMRLEEQFDACTDEEIASMLEAVAKREGCGRRMHFVVDAVIARLHRAGGGACSSLEDYRAPLELSPKLLALISVGVRNA